MEERNRKLSLQVCRGRKEIISSQTSRSESVTEVNPAISQGGNPEAESIDLHFLSNSLAHAYLAFLLILC